MIDIEYRISTFPSSEKFRIFRVINTHVWQIITQKAYYLDDLESKKQIPYYQHLCKKAYYLDDLEWDYFDFKFDDPVTAQIICDMLNDEIGGELND